jgi:hypothetical protein
MTRPWFGKFSKFRESADYKMLKKHKILELPRLADINQVVWQILTILAKCPKGDPRQNVHICKTTFLRKMTFAPEIWANFVRVW